MTYRINSGAIHEYLGRGTGPKLQRKGNFVVAIDPSKTNLAFVTGNERGVVYEWVELSGKGCDTTAYCNDLMNFMADYLSNGTVTVAGVEQAVMYEGMKYYHSQMVLTEIRANILQGFLQRFNIKIHEINNYAWKGAILPDGYRGRKEKGSLRFLAEKGLTGITDDVSDAICIYFYLNRFVEEPEVLNCTYEEEPLYEYDYAIVPDNFNIADLHEVFIGNGSVSLKGNAAYFLNRTNASGFAFTYPVTSLTLDDIYNGNSHVNSPTLDTVKVVVARC